MTAIRNGKIVTPDGIIENKTVFIDGDIIEAVSDSDSGAKYIIDAQGRYITPGFIDVHSDRIEQIIQPRPTSQMDFELALKVCELELMHLGITTMYHSLSLFKDEFFGKSPLRTKENVLRIADLIHNIHMRNHLIRHRFHLRIEIDNIGAYDIAKMMIERNLVHEISFMDHTPGQGQYRSLEIYEKTISKHHGREIVTFGMDGIIEYHRNKEVLTFEQIKQIADMAHASGIAVASHDDDTEEKLEVNRKLGVDISEFPVVLETAKAAQKNGFYTVVGAPNILLGCSHSGNMSAAEAIREDCADILCSDYYPPAILHSIFTINRDFGIPLHEMVSRATLNPAKAMKTDGEFGSVETGKKADLLIIDVLDGYPVITNVFVGGNMVSGVQYRR